MIAADEGMDSNTPIDELQFCTRLYNTLKRNDLHVIGDLLLLTEAAFRRIRNIDSGDWETVQAALAQTGLTRHDVPVTQLWLASNLHDALQHNGIATVGQLLAWTPAGLLCLPHLSEADLVAVQEALARYGLRLRTRSE